MKLLLDEMWPPAVAEALRQRGHDVVAVAARRDLRGASDEAVVEAARTEGRVIVTENVVDYCQLQTAAMHAGRDYPSLILTNNEGWPRANPAMRGRLIKALDDLLTANDAIEVIHWLEQPLAPADLA